MTAFNLRDHNAPPPAFTQVAPVLAASQYFTTVNQPFVPPNK
ncbi:hypothetical protein [Nocardia abscessus]|nr:hypothetical protein [Nocardia abscessus]